MTSFGRPFEIVAGAFGQPNRPAWQVVHAFIAGLGLPRTLAAVNVGPAQFDAVAKAALLEYYIHNNPRPIHGLEDVMEILRLAA